MVDTNPECGEESINRLTSYTDDVSFQPNTIYCGDCADVLQRFPENSVDLIYADPPFFSNQQYEVLWGDGYELRAFEDRWKGGIQNYISWMEPKLRECQRVLKENGSMYLHCDWHASHYLKVIMDKLFGDQYFRNEIVWKRTSAHTGEGAGTVQRYGTVHDVILFYAKSDSYTFNPIYMPYDKAYTETFYKNIDSNGRRYMSDNLTAAGIRHGDSGKPWRGIDPASIGRHWVTSPNKLEEWAAEGKILFPKKAGGTPRFKRYLDEAKGLLVQDVWMDIQPLSSHSGERMGYPTQKPEALLERILTVSSNPTDLILDPFCGCGTTIVAAQRLGRRWIGVDISPTAAKLMRDRLRKLRVSCEIIGLPRSIVDVRKLEPFEFQNWVFEKLRGRVNPRKVGDFGIDGWVELDVPLQVKQSDAVGRNVVDNFQTAIQRAGKTRGVIVAFSFGSGAYEEAARAKNDMNLDIKLKTVEEILKET